MPSRSGARGRCFGINLTVFPEFPSLPSLLQLSPHSAMCVLKTWLNGWTTSHRMHEPFLRSCIFGCVDAHDDLCHYVQCEALWTAVGNASGVFSSSLAERIGVTEATSATFHNIVVAFTTYHMCKNVRASSIGANIVDISHTCALAAHRRFRPAMPASRPGIVPAVAARASNTRPRFGTLGTREPSNTTVAEPQFAIAVPVASHTRFIQGGDHFMTTSFTSTRA